MGQPEPTDALGKAMFAIVAQAESQMAGHVPFLENSARAWQAVADRLGVTAGTLRNPSSGVADTWTDEIGASCSEQLDGSAGTVADWETALTAANLPAIVTQLGAAVRTTGEGGRAAQKEYNEIAARPVQDESTYTANETERAAVVQRAAKLLE